MGNMDEHLSPPSGLPPANVFARVRPAAAKDAHPIRVNPCESVSHFYQFSDLSPEHP
jgi:hypothetical protein